jgi:hypothetical protein
VVGSSNTAYCKEQHRPGREVSCMGVVGRETLGLVL